MSDISTIRHDEIFNARKNNGRITILGAGATGSRVFASLVELGLTNIAIYDFDKVEAHNLANQIFGENDIGALKVSALFDWYQRKTGAALPPPEMHFIADTVPIQDYSLYEGEEFTPDIAGTVFLLTDTMQSRREIFDTCIKDNLGVFRVIETRMASTHGNVYTFNPHDRHQKDAWLDSLIDDDDGEVSACGSSISVGTTASIIANMAVWQYMHAKTDPAAGDGVVDVYLKPFCLTTRKLHNEPEKEEKVA